MILASSIYTVLDTATRQLANASVNIDRRATVIDPSTPWRASKKHPPPVITQTSPSLKPPINAARRQLKAHSHKCRLQTTDRMHAFNCRAKHFPTVLKIDCRLLDSGHSVESSPRQIEIVCMYVLFSQ